MDPVTLLEHRCADAWPAVAEERIGQWRRRAAGGFTGRANSTLPLGDPGVPVAAALRGSVTFAERHGIAPRAQVVVGSAAERGLADAGWVLDDGYPGGPEVAVLTGPVAGLAATSGLDLVTSVAVHDAPPPGWWRFTVDADEPTPAQRRVLTGAEVVGFGAAVRGGADGPEVVGGVRGAVVADLLHVARLAVRPDLRGRGLARALLAELAHWAAERGATRCALQVSVRNEPALRLYRSLGCVEHHRYRYWIPG